VTTDISRVTWQPSYRIIPSRFPPINLFERVADPEDWEAIIEVESLTNPRLRDEAGDVSLVSVDERISGPGTSIIMAAFTHLNPAGSRFTDGTYGVFYTTPDLETAIAETKHHRERFMRETGEAPIHLDMRVYLVDLDAELHDIRGKQSTEALVYHLEKYAAAQHFARTLKESGSNGIVYSSVRRAGGECAAVLRPRVLSNCRQERHLSYVWDGAQISNIYEKRSLT
jgi:hypothetical protein